MSLNGFTDRNPYSCKQRWQNYLNVDAKSDANQNEINIIIELYRERVSFGDISKHLKGRSGPWVRIQYEKLFRNYLRLVREHLKEKISNGDICNRVKNGKLSIVNFKHVDQQEQEDIQKCLEFISFDQTGHKMLEVVKDAVKRYNTRKSKNHNSPKLGTKRSFK